MTLVNNGGVVAAQRAVVDMSAERVTHVMAVNVVAPFLCVRPRFIDTDIHASGGEPARAEPIGMVVPLRRPGPAAEVASAPVWLCSAASACVTGAPLDAGDGR